MKKVIALIIAVAMVASMGIFSAFAAEDKVIDISGLKTNVRGPIDGWAAAGWPEGNGDYLIQMMNHGEAINLGSIDLTQYESITITYGRDSSHETDEKGGFVLGDKAVQNADATIVEDAVIYADFADSMDHEAANPPVPWADFEPDEITVKIDSSKYVAGSDVWLSVRVLQCVEESCAAGDSRPYIGFALTSIKFNAKSGEQSGEPTNSGEPATSDQPTDPDNTDTADGTAIVFMIAAAAVVATLLLKKKVF